MTKADCFSRHCATSTASDMQCWQLAASTAHAGIAGKPYTANAAKTATRQSLPTDFAKSRVARQLGSEISTSFVARLSALHWEGPVQCRYCSASARLSGVARNWTVRLTITVMREHFRPGLPKR
jgi:hypothetical protein